MTVAMFGFGFLLVPLYDAFCEVTGFGGRTNNVAHVAVETPDLSRSVRVEFVTTVNAYAPWTFEADVDSIAVHPGKMYYATFSAQNMTKIDKVAQAEPANQHGNNNADSGQHDPEACFSTVEPIGNTDHQEQQADRANDRPVAAMRNVVLIVCV